MKSETSCIISLEVLTMYIRKFLSYAFTFMVGYYLGSGGCIDRFIDSKPGKLECKIQDNYQKYKGDDYYGKMP